MDVYYPLGGPYLLLHWSRHNDGGHVILTKSRRSLEVVLDRIISTYGASSYDGPNVKSLNLVEIVAPPERFTKAKAVFDHQDAIRSFQQDVCQRIHASVSAGKDKLPPPFSWHPSSDECAECAECLCPWYGAGIHIAMTGEAFYERYHAKWSLQQPTRESLKWKESAPRYQHGFSRARTATEGQPLFYAHPQFGHHRPGVCLSPVEEQSEGQGRPGHLSDVLFFYHVTEVMDPGPFTDRIVAERTRRKEAEKKLSDTRKKKDEAEKRAWTDVLWSVFGADP